MHNDISKLRGILFGANLTKNRDDNRLEASSLLALNIEHSVIYQAALADSRRTIPGQAPDKILTSLADKETAIAPLARPFGENLNACSNDRDKTVTSNRVNTATPLIKPCKKTPQEQTTNEWLSDFNSPSPY